MRPASDCETRSILESHPLRGAVFESYVVSELVRAFANAGREAPLFHWKDTTGHEVDVVIDLADRLIPVEVKSGITVAPDAVDTMRWWLGLEGNPGRGGALVHAGTVRTTLRDVAVLPWFLA